MMKQAGMIEQRGRKEKMQYLGVQSKRNQPAKNTGIARHGTPECPETLYNTFYMIACT